jgi:hypothetical protein
MAKDDFMDDGAEEKNTTWGIIAGLGCAALLMFYAVSTGATQGGSRGQPCSTCRQAGGVPQNFGGAATYSKTNR